MAEVPLIDCEVAYARPDRQFLLQLSVPAGATAHSVLVEALRRGLRDSCPEIDENAVVLGVFGNVVPADHPLQPGDRVEIYRPLSADPRVARRERAKQRR